MSDALPRNLVQMSIVKIVDAELKTDVKEDMRAAIITASIRPLNPVISIVYVLSPHDQINL